MTAATSISTRARQTLFVSAVPKLDIERICREYSETENPPEAFMVNSELIEGQLLAMNLEFLEKGQQLPCPGLPLAGAAFDPSWGFSRAEIGMRSDGSAEFRLASIDFEGLASDNTYGYRMCIVDNYEVSEVIGQLAYIRTELAQRSREPNEHAGVRVTITRL